MKIFSIIVLVLGILGVVLGILVTGISAALPELSNGVSLNEAMPGIIGGAVLLVLSFFVFVLGLILFFVARKRGRAANLQ